ncbi:hypothetical protein AMTRI_Chr06g171050 [Amborella trichopoda]
MSTVGCLGCGCGSISAGCLIRRVLVDKFQLLCIIVMGYPLCFLVVATFACHRIPNYPSMSFFKKKRDGEHIDNLGIKYLAFWIFLCETLHNTNLFYTIM